LHSAVMIVIAAVAGVPASVREDLTRGEPGCHSVDEVGYSSRLIGVKLHVQASGVEPSGLGALNVGARAPALISTPGRPKAEESRLRAKYVSERPLESRVVELRVRLAKQTHERRVVRTFDNHLLHLRAAHPEATAGAPGECERRAAAESVVRLGHDPNETPQSRGKRSQGTRTVAIPTSTTTDTAKRAKPRIARSQALNFSLATAERSTT